MSMSRRSQSVRLTNPGRDWLQEGGPCEIQPVGVRHLSAGRLRAPAARDSGLNYNQRKKERKLMQGEQELRAVSYGGSNHNQLN
jgi:hypothetical protein